MSRAPLVLVVGSLVLRFSLISAGALILCATSSGQTQQVMALKIPGPVKDAGIYHVVTGTWTRNAGSSGNLGPDVIARSDSFSGYFGVGWEGGEGVDEIILPGSGNPLGQPGVDVHQIDGFAFSYCSQTGGPLNMRFRMYESYVPCDIPENPSNCLATNYAICLQGLPNTGCWGVTVDLMGGAEFSLEADGGSCAPGYQTPASGLDHSGWGLTWWTTDGAFVGPILAGGDENWAGDGEGTCYNPGFATCPAGQANALGHRDLFAIGQFAANPGCYWFGYNNTNGCGSPNQCPSAQFYWIYYTTGSGSGLCDVQGPGPDYFLFCNDATDPTGGPPGNNYQVNDTVLGIDTVQTGGSINITLSDCRAGFEGQFGFLLVGTGTGVSVDPPGARGHLCLIGAAIGRYNADAGAITNSVLNTDIWNGNTGGGNGDLPNPPGGSIQPGQTWRFQAWHRDGPVNPSRFSTGIEVTFR